MSKYWESSKIEKKNLGRKGEGFIAEESIAKGEKLIRFDGEISEEPDRMTLQIEKNKHLGGPGGVNHSCNPNCRIKLNPARLIASEPIDKGEEITFNYLTTEWEFEEVFKCECGSKKCIGEIRGYKHLTKKEKKKLGNVKSHLLDLEND